jgi:hypothetical protein
VRGHKVVSKRNGGEAPSLTWLTSRTPSNGVEVVVAPAKSKSPPSALSSNSTVKVRAECARSFMNES